MFFSSFVFSLKGALHWWNGVSPSKLAIYKIQAATGAKLFWMEWKVWTSCVPPAENRNYCVNVDQVWSNLPAVKLLPLKWNRIWAGATPMRAKWIKLDLVWTNRHVVIASTMVPPPSKEQREILSQAKLVAHLTKRFHWSRLTELSEEPEQRPTNLNISRRKHKKFSQFSC